MPSARPSQFRGAAGILRDVDGTITGLTFTDKNPLAGRGTPKPGQKKSDFHSLFAVVDVRVDGATQSSPQPIFVGSADDFGVTEDAMGLTGDGQLSKSSGWYIFLNSLVTSGFDENNFPDDDPNVADYSALVGARVRFNWQVNEKATKKYGKKLSKTIDPKTGKPKSYDREDLIVTNYYGQVEVEAEPKGKPMSSKSARPANEAVQPGAAKKASKKAAAVDVSAIGIKNVIDALAAAKGNTMSKQKLSVKILTQMATDSPETRDAVRTWAFEDANLSSIEGVNYDAATQTLTLDAGEESDE
jgi:hypothetical protein